MGMSCCEERERPRKSCAPVHANAGFAAGVLFALLVYFLVRQQTAISAATTAALAQWSTVKQLIRAPGETQLIKAPGEILVTSDVHRVADKQPIQDTGEQIIKLSQSFRPNLHACSVSLGTQGNHELEKGRII
uniref:Uncharacterized protein n=1 Tax=Aegilops tauschii TaxID=37682 RepID=R7VYG7_AEGTA